MSKESDKGKEKKPLDERTEAKLPNGKASKTESRVAIEPILKTSSFLDKVNVAVTVVIRLSITPVDWSR
nr:hypothetical protein BEI47_00455 [Aliivibrio fischeri]